MRVPHTDGGSGLSVADRLSALSPISQTATGSSVSSGGAAWRPWYLAEDVGHRRRVAIKVLHPELSAVLGPERFLKEIESGMECRVGPHVLLD
jgi:hypothetical protein